MLNKIVGELVPRSEFEASSECISSDWKGPVIEKPNPSSMLKAKPSEYYETQMRQMLSFEPARREDAGIVRAKKAIIVPNEELYEDQKKLWVRVKDKLVAISNFIVKLDCIVIRHSLQNTEKFFKVRICSTFKEIPLEIPQQQFLSLASILGRSHPEYRIEPSHHKRHELFRSYLSQLVEKAASMSVPEICTYTYAGWQNINGLQMHYFSALDRECTSEISLVPLHTLSTGQIVEGIKFLAQLSTMGEKTVMVPMFLYKFAGVLAAPFREAMKPITFILDICGPTGIGKTAVSRPFYGDFDASLEITNFTATASGIDRFIQSKHDFVALLDDLSSITDREALRTLERTLRQFCDSNGRITAARGGGINRIDTRCGLVLTSEGPLEGTRQSSQLRILVIPVQKNSFEEELVPLLRSDAMRRQIPGTFSLMDIGMTAFIRYVEVHYQDIKLKIAGYRAEQLPTEFRRLQASYEALVIIAEIVDAFLKEYGISALGDKLDLPTWKAHLKQIILYNSSLGEIANPVGLFLTTIVQRINQNLIPIATSREIFAENTAAYYGYWENDGNSKKLKVDPDRIFTDAMTCFKKASFKAPFTQAEILRKLADMQLSETYKQKGRASKAVKSIRINGQSLRMLVLDWYKVNCYLEK